jgi:Domain of unknown function (DUF4136)
MVEVLQSQVSLRVHLCLGTVENNRRLNMRVAKLNLSLLPITAALLLSGCVVPTGPVEVTRFNRAAEGQAYGKGSFAVVVADGTSSLSASPYLAAVTREMQRVGYLENSAASDVIASVNYSVLQADAARGRSPVSVGVGGSTGGYRSGVGVGVGLDLTSLLNKPKARILTELSVRIKRRGDDLIIWEGKAVQESSVGTPAAQPGIAASKLAEALFRDFPGKSGETVTVR